MRASFSLIFGAMALAVGCDALADGSGRMGEVERTRFRAELLRLDVAGSRPAPGMRPDATVPGVGAGGGGARLSPEERRALREQLRHNLEPFEARSAGAQAQPRRQPPR